MPLTVWLALATTGLLLATVAQLARNGRALLHLRDVAPLRGADVPRLSVVIAARNEARNLEQALRSVLRQQYPALEVIVVNDRSTDATASILDRMAGENPRLRVVHVAELPPGWLGKNHALYAGAALATGELLLFTDADVVLEPATVARAAAAMRAHHLDHLTANPELRMPGWFLQAFGVTFGVLFVLFTRPWKVSDPRSRAHLGIGAFNLLRTTAYRKIGTHRALAMRPDDDMKLGKLVKKHGLRQQFAVGVGLISVEWYASVREAARGLRKNAFAGLDYQLSAVVGATLALLLLFVWPFVAVIATDGWAQLLNGAAVLLLLSLYAGAAHRNRAAAWHALVFPLGVLFFLFVLWRSTVYTLRRGGIEWRGTHYPLHQLKANRI